MNELQPSPQRWFCSLDNTLYTTKQATGSNKMGSNMESNRMGSFTLNGCIFFGVGTPFSDGLKRKTTGAPKITTIIIIIIILGGGGQGGRGAGGPSLNEPPKWVPRVHCEPRRPESFNRVIDFLKNTTTEHLQHGCGSTLGQPPNGLP